MPDTTEFVPNEAGMQVTNLATGELFSTAALDQEVTVGQKRWPLQRNLAEHGNWQPSH